MGWEQREGPRGQREGPRGSRKGPEFSRFVSCSLDSPALVTQPRVPAVFLRGLQRPLGNPGADTCGPPGAASLLPALAESRQAREATDGRAARRQGGARSPAAFRVDGGGRRHGRADSLVGFEKDPTLLSRGIRTSNRVADEVLGHRAQGWKGPQQRGGHPRPSLDSRLLAAWPGLAPRPPADRVSGRPRRRGRRGRAREGALGLGGAGAGAGFTAAPRPSPHLRPAGHVHRSHSPSAKHFTDGDPLPVGHPTSHTLASTQSSRIFQWDGQLMIPKF